MRIQHFHGDPPGVTTLYLTTEMASPHDVTKILELLRQGDDDASERLIPLVYDSLKAIAGRHLAHERRDHTLQPTALVHEAYLQLVDDASRDWKNRAHFFGVASRVIRRILVDHARSHLALKRGGDRERVTLSEDVAFSESRELDVLALDDALEQLFELHDRQARVVELRFFGGLSVEEVALALHVSPRTVKGDWRVARAWLARELSEESPA